MVMKTSRLIGIILAIGILSFSLVYVVYRKEHPPTIQFMEKYPIGEGEWKAVFKVNVDFPISLMQKTNIEGMALASPEIEVGSSIIEFEWIPLDPTVVKVSWGYVAVIYKPP